MSSTALAVAGLIAGAATTLFGSLSVYLVQARKISGQVATSEAAQLWEEARAIREEHHARLRELESVIAQREDRIRELNAVIARCEDRIGTLERKEGELVRDNNRLRGEVEKLEAQIDNWGPH